MASNKTALSAEELIRSKMQKEKIPEIVIRNFLRLYTQVKTGQTGEIRENQIDPVEKLPKYEDIQNYAEYGRQNLRKLAALKLNGGLGTSMGLNKAKTLLAVKPGITFLDVIAQAAIKQNAALVLMDSFNTDIDTKKYLKKYKKLKYELFLQNKHPKIYQDTLLPAAEKNDEYNWNPPGHGDLYPALVLTGTLEKLLSQGYEYIFIANGDNLGATADAAILGYLLKEKIPFLMEVAERTPADKKGGHLAIRKTDGQLILREAAQCHPADEGEFQNIEKYKFFNNNNIWIELKSLQTKLKEYDNVLPLPLIRNSKPVNPTVKTSAKVYQLETACGAAIELFAGAQGLVTPKARFAPVKKCSDLLALWSDIYILTSDYRIELNPERRLPPIEINLDDRHYSMIKDFTARFRHVPSLLNCSKLEIRGDIAFGPKVVLGGSINITNNSSSQFILQNLQVSNAEIVINKAGKYLVKKGALR